MSMPLRRGREGSTDGLLSPKRRRLECEPSSSAGTGTEHPDVGPTLCARAQGVCKGQHHQSAREAVHGAAWTAACASARTCNFSEAKSCHVRQTFVDVTIEPGPTLNVVLGPNGALPVTPAPSLAFFVCHTAPVLDHAGLCSLERAPEVWPRSHGPGVQAPVRARSCARCAWASAATPRRAPHAHTCPGDSASTHRAARQAARAARTEQRGPQQRPGPDSARRAVGKRGVKLKKEVARSCWGARRTPRSSSATARPRA